MAAFFPAKNLLPTGRLLPALVALAFACSACAPKPSTPVAPDAKTGLTPVDFQLDWYPAPEHGGHYQALVKNYYRDAGLDVQILSGGPGAYGIQKVATGQCAFAMSSADEIILAAAQGLPLLIVAAYMQHGPQAVMVHAESPVRTFKDLDGRTVMGSPGANWVAYLKKHHGIAFNVIPTDYGLSRFMADKDFIQQCFISNEPYHAELNGAPARALLIADGGYDPYRVLFTSQAFARNHPEQVRAFVAASIRGWREFINGDNADARKAVAQANPSQTPALIDYSIAAMKRYHLVEGDAAKGERAGLLTKERFEALSGVLLEIGALSAPLPLERYVSFDFLPPELTPSGPSAARSASP